MDIRPLPNSIHPNPPDGNQAALVRAPWIGQLRTNCEVLHQLPDQVATAVSVSVHLASGSKEEVAALEQSSRSLAQEYGFTVLVRVSGRSATVRFAREEAVTPPNSLPDEREGA